MIWLEKLADWIVYGSFRYWLLEIVFGAITIFISCFLVAVMLAWLT